MSHVLRQWRLILAVVCVAGALIWWARLSTGMQPPVPPDMTRIDPLVRDKLVEALAYVQQAPGAPSMWLQLARLYDANGFGELARTCYEEAVRLSPSDARAWYLLASVRRGLGDSDSAMQAARRSVEIDGRYAPSLARLASWELDAGRLPESRQLIEQALRVDATNRAARAAQARLLLNEGRADQAHDVLAAMLAEQPLDSYAQHLMQEAQRQTGGSPAGAQATYPMAPPQHSTADVLAERSGARTTQRADAHYPDPWRDEMRRFRTGYVQLMDNATAEITAGRPEEAIRILEPLMQRFSDRSTLANNLAFAYIRVGRVADGIALVRKSLETYPDLATLHVTLAIGLAVQGDLQASRVEVDKALQLDPTFRPGLRHKAELLERAGDLEGTLEALTLLAQGSTDEDVEAQMALGRVQGRLGRWADAAATLESVGQRHPGLLDAHLGAGLARLELGQFELADAGVTRAEQGGAPANAIAQLRAMIQQRRDAAAPSAPGAPSLPPSGDQGP